MQQLGGCLGTAPPLVLPLPYPLAPASYIVALRQETPDLELHSLMQAIQTL